MGVVLANKFRFVCYNIKANSYARYLSRMDHIKHVFEIHFVFL